jgi:general secretion pathway protein K
MNRIAAPLEERHGHRDGFIVVAALWLLVALAVLAATASVFMAQSAKILPVNDAAIQSELLIAAGLELTAYQLSIPAANQRPRRGGFSFNLAKSNVALEFLSEAARVNLNMAPKAMIAGLFAAVGAQPTAAERFAERVIGWRSAPKPNAQDEEEALYRAAGLTYPPRRGPFEHVDELWLVQGLPPALVQHALPFVTVYSGMGEVNVLDAAPVVIASLPGMTPARLDAFLSQRESLPPDPQFVLGALGGKQLGATTRASDAYRVRMRITFPDRRQQMSEGVIMLMGPGVKEAYRVLSWRDHINAGEPPR